MFARARLLRPVPYGHCVLAPLREQRFLKQKSPAKALRRKAITPAEWCSKMLSGKRGEIDDGQNAGHNAANDQDLGAFR